MAARGLFRRHVALPADHGSWVLLVGPLLIGLFAGGRWTTPSLYLVIASFAGFLLRQPITLAVKAYSGRRSREVLPAVWFWTAVYTAIGLVQIAGLAVRGFGYLVWLALPGILVFGWYLYLIGRRAERRQMTIEVAAAGVLALTAPAAMWIGVGRVDPSGWLLWALVWTHSAASIAHAYLRLAQRALDRTPGAAGRLRMAGLALVWTSVNLVTVAALSAGGVTPAWLLVPYAIQWGETVWCTWRPAIGLKPTAIGYRQLIVSALFTLLFVITWRS